MPSPQSSSFSQPILFPQLRNSLLLSLPPSLPSLPSLSLSLSLPLPLPPSPSLIFPLTHHVRLPRSDAGRLQQSAELPNSYTEWLAHLFLILTTHRRTSPAHFK